jgi:hypothetical protein
MPSPAKTSVLKSPGKKANQKKRDIKSNYKLPSKVECFKFSSPVHQEQRTQSEREKDKFSNLKQEATTATFQKMPIIAIQTCPTYDLHPSKEEATLNPNENPITADLLQNKQLM